MSRYPGSPLTTSHNCISDGYLWCELTESNELPSANVGKRITKQFEEVEQILCKSLQRFKAFCWISQSDSESCPWIASLLLVDNKWEWWEMDEKNGSKRQIDISITTEFGKKMLINRTSKTEFDAISDI